MLCNRYKASSIEPMGFRINEKNLKRAGMDYWDDLDVTIYDSFKVFYGSASGNKDMDGYN